MKKQFLLIILTGILLALANVTWSSNPTKSTSLSPPPPPPDSVQIIVDLGPLSCVSLACEYFSVYITGSGSPQYLVTLKHYDGWGTFKIPWTAVDETCPKQICVRWDFQGICTPALSTPLICCVPYTGTGTYRILCNPCD